MHLKTIQATAFRNIFEVLKDIINDVNVYFDADGIRILSLDTARVSLVHMHLSSENFEEYTCPSPIIAGMNMSNTYKLLKSVTNNDTLTLTCADSEYVEFVIENETKKSKTKFSLKLLDINEDILDVPELQMDVMTTIPSVDFQRICRDMGNLATDIEIYRDGTELQLSCKGDFANQSTVIECPTKVDCKVGNLFSLKYMNLFTKATGMCSSVQLLQHVTESDMPIVLKYSIANLGDMKFYLAPKVD
jgi:proliferating cell nuclear antigen